MLDIQDIINLAAEVQQQGFCVDVRIHANHNDDMIIVFRSEEDKDHRSFFGTFGGDRALLQIEAAGARAWSPLHQKYMSIEEGLKLLQAV